MIDEQSSDEITRSWAIKTALCISPLYLLFHHLGDPAKGRAACIVAYTIALAVKIHWESGRHVWFWVTIAMIVLLHIPLVLFIPWTNTDYPGIALLPVALADYGFVYGCLKLGEKLMKRERRPDETRTSDE